MNLVPAVIALENGRDLTQNQALQRKLTFGFY
jgi:hypothetical protein